MPHFAVGQIRLWTFWGVVSSPTTFCVSPPWVENPRRNEAVSKDTSVGQFFLSAYLPQHTRSHVRAHTLTHMYILSKDTAGEPVCVYLCDPDREICPPTHPSVTYWCRAKCPPPYNTVTHHSHCPARLPPPLRGQIWLRSPICATHTHTHTPVPPLTSIHLLSAVSTLLFSLFPAQQFSHSSRL